MLAQKKLIVIGGGAAGFFCAVNAARLCPNLQVIILEKTNKLLSKVKVSGGGRCNVTHDCASISEMIKNYPRGNSFLKKAFTKHFTTDTINWFEQRRVKLKTEKDGRMFPITDSSQTIIDCLLQEASKYKVEVRLSTTVTGITQQDGKYVLHLQNDKQEISDFLCIAAGGFSSLSKFDWLSALGHQIISPVPSLFTFNMPGNTLTKLMGIAVQNVQVKIAGTKLENKGPLLITHWGLSGPAILKLSAKAATELAAKNYNFNIVVNWVSEYNEESIRQRLQMLRNEKASSKILNKNIFELPSRLWEYFLIECGITEEKRFADVTAAEQNKLAKKLCNDLLQVQGKTTFKEEFVTAGGIALQEINSLTMESRLHKKLFFAGEIIDADGVTGGFNFQNAWTTGFIAASSITESFENELQ